jgi:cell division septation protein DedD
LETTRDKLLQIVLVGDFKLADMLGSHELRQIGQRVSVNYTVQPLTAEETRDYIFHRLRIAGQGPKPRFDPSASRHIFKYSQGIPRTINMVCDKSLYKAYGVNSTVIDGDIVKAAILDLTGGSALPRPGLPYTRRIALIAAGCGLLFLICLIAYLPLRQKDQIVADKVEIHTAAIPTQEQSEPIGLSELPAPPAESDFDNTPPAKMENRPDIQTEAEEVSPPEPFANQQPPAEMTHSVQVGAFIDIKNAETLMATLHAKGYPARMIRIPDSRGLTWYAVRIGDYPSREMARQHAKTFSAREKMESIVRPYGKM